MYKNSWPIFFLFNRFLFLNYHERQRIHFYVKLSKGFARNLCFFLFCTSELPWDSSPGGKQRNCALSEMNFSRRWREHSKKERMEETCLRAKFTFILNNNNNTCKEREDGRRSPAASPTMSWERSWIDPKHADSQGVQEKRPFLKQEMAWVSSQMNECKHTQKGERVACNKAGLFDQPLLTDGKRTLSLFFPVH